MRNKCMEADDISLWDDTVDIENTTFLEDQVTTSGWPLISDVGEEASQAAWLLVQHADHDPEFQAYCLGLMRVLPTTEVKPANIAYLEDRIRVAQGRPQLYGTQFYKEGDAMITPRPIEDETHLEQRRAAMGLETFEANKRRMIERYGNQGRA